MKYTFRSEKELQEVIQACAGIPQKVIDNAKYHIGLVYKMSRPNVQKILYKNVQLVCLS